uniref:Uncharacterized protein n=1 Tax=Moniliophthora roreri TaxID=221103 RepID=A0A0W0FF65_MONRR
MQMKTEEYMKAIEAKAQQPSNMKLEDKVYISSWEDFLAEFEKSFKPIDAGTDILSTTCH